MAASYNDKFLLAQDSGFRNRVEMSLIAACEAIMTESPTAVPFHAQRSQFATSALNTPSVAATMLALGVATDANVIADATAAGTVVLTPANVAAQAALVTDAHIDTAISGQFNDFFLHPA
jgi:hypothetical protein